MTDAEKEAIFKEVLKEKSKKGGKSTFERHGKEHYRKMNQKSQLSRFGKIKDDKDN